MPQSVKRRIFVHVVGSERLGVRDFDRTLELVREAAGADGEQPFEEPLIHRLMRLVPADWAGYYEFRIGDPVNLYEASSRTEPDDFDWTAPQNREAVLSWPLLDERRGRARTALKLSDFLTGRALRRSVYYSEVMRLGGCRHEMKVWLPAGGDLYRGFYVIRANGRRDFDERDRAVLTLLRPHLFAIRRRWEGRRRVDGLTEREVEVMRLVRRGLTNREIADRLVISAGTVRTHLQHVFEKLDVHTRTAAVDRAFRSGRGPRRPSGT